MVQRMRTRSCCLASCTKIIVGALYVHALVAHTKDALVAFIAHRSMMFLGDSEIEPGSDIGSMGGNMCRCRFYLEQAMCRGVGSDGQRFTCGAYIIIRTLCIHALVTYASDGLVAIVTCCVVTLTRRDSTDLSISVSLD